ncbi:N-acetylmuramoyl-L-alanine amidase [Metabacillus sp. GX 13764]|uniref:N-acetylmuramoyl-L-alanine amidase n=1 Tax=Metabacillus kandeliae TaxID=2900151 RepID=UPI001E3BA53D|nr:N-acetylmuramoyl-L-alanine amidase [Metabacillus kandeliae]MCD7035892.1 N-acetylmuramoyl-L-alanine amidase [Metabacillus kandeliae]
MLIIADAGHGYSTPGKRTVDGMREYEFNREVAHHLKIFLEKYQNTAVLFSHSDKRDVPLSERTSLANSHHADLFVSIHANASGDGKTWNGAGGIETFVHTSFPLKAFQLAQLLQKKLTAATCRKSRGIKGADFYVLKHTKMPAVLVECGFMTNKEEAGLLRTAAYQERCAWAIAEGIVERYGLLRR